MIKNKIKVFIAILIVVISIIAFKGYRLYSEYSKPPQITIINDSNSDLTNITLCGVGFNKKIGDIFTGKSLKVEVKPRSESSLEISFTANSKKYTKDDLAYIEPRGGYIVKLTIDETFNIKSENGLDIN